MNIQGRPTPVAKFNPELITLTAPPPRRGAKPNLYGNSFFIRYNNGPARFAFPELRTAFGVRASELSDAKTLQIAFELDAVGLDMMEKLSTRIKELVSEHKNTLFSDGASVKDEELASRVVPFVKDSMGYPTSFRADLVTDAQDREKILSVIGKPFLIDEQKNEIPVSRSTIESIVGRGARVKPVVEIKHLFVSKDKKASIKWLMSHGKLCNADGGDGMNWDVDDDENAPPISPPPSPANSQAGVESEDAMDSD